VRHNRAVRRHPRLAVSPLAGAVFLVLAACGSTVQMHSTNRQVTGGNDLSVAAGGVSGELGDQGTGAATGDIGATGGGSVTGATSSRVSGGRTTGGATSTVAGTGPGVTDDTISVGVIYSVNGDAVNKAAGANGISTGDEQKNANAVIDDINKNGGIAGRKVVPVFAPFDATSTQTIDQQYNTICTDFTQDHKVMVAFAQGTESWRQCLLDHGVAVMDSDLPTSDTAEFQRHWNYIELGYPNVDRIASFLTTALVDQNYFSGWNEATGAPDSSKVTIGIIATDTDPFRHAVDGILVPNLKRLGYTAQTEYIAEVQTASDYSSEAAAVSSAELKFRQAHVDHVIDFDSNGQLALFFMNTASSQRYYPRYAGHTGSAFEVLVSTNDAPADQFRGAVGFGWDPGIDLPADQNGDNGPYSNDARKKCLKVYKDHGITFQDANSEGIGLGTCSELWLVRAALTPAPSVINLTTFVRAVEHVGSSFQAAGVLGEQFGAGRHDGISRAYYWQFVPSCTCMHYVGPLRTVP